jgi:hypothetical protein
MTKNPDGAKKSDIDDQTPGGGRSRDMSGASYGATEREQTEDLRRRSPQGDANVADGGVSEELEYDSDSPAD